ncbi:Uncharacterised protein [Bordetella pertussis]|nr:Uncharacterised protein [Bordetella pertussis]
MRSRHTSPILTIGTTALMIVPTTCTTRPFIRSVDRSCRATRIISVM